MEVESSGDSDSCRTTRSIDTLNIKCSGVEGRMAKKMLWHPWVTVLAQMLRMWAVPWSAVPKAVVPE